MQDIFFSFLLGGELDRLTLPALSGEGIRSVVCLPGLFIRLIVAANLVAVLRDIYQMDAVPVLHLYPVRTLVHEEE